MSPADSLNEEEFFSEAPDVAAKRILRQAAPFAASAISRMAQDDTISPSVRLRAAQYIVDRELGPVGAGNAEKSELETFLEDLSREANKGH